MKLRVVALLAASVLVWGCGDDSSGSGGDPDGSQLSDTDAGGGGGDTAEGDTAGGDTAEGDTAGGDTAEGDTVEGDTAEGDTAGGDTAEGDTVGGDTAEGDTAEGDTGEGPTVGLVTNGQWFVNVGLSIGLDIPLQWTVETVDNGDGTGTFTSIEMRASTADGTGQSDVVATFEDVAVDADGNFEFGQDGVMLPGPYNPTGLDVSVDLVFYGQVQGIEFLCGTVSGAAPVLELDLQGSTFAAVPWAAFEANPTVPKACEEVVVEYPHIEVCPELTAGKVTGFDTGGLERSFELRLPSDFDGETSRPLVFLFHGLGGDPAGILDETGMGDLVDAFDIILVIPYSTEAAVEWTQLQSVDANEDLVFFDDIVQCAGEKLNADLDRVHVTGMSAGGLFTTYLAMLRSETIASVAPMSGGLLIKYVDTDYNVPFLMTWGGPEDEAYETDFNAAALELKDDLTSHGHPLTFCEHDMGHEVPPEMSGPILEYFAAHPKGTEVSPWEQAVPEDLPDYCTVVNQSAPQ